MKKIAKRLKERYTQLKNHPITSGKELIGLFNYISFHLRIRFSKELTYKWIEGLKFFARRGDAGIVGNIYFGMYEFEESIFLLHLLEKEDLFLDIGSNVGHYSLLMSGVKKCKSIAVEPVPKTYKQLIRQITLNNLGHLIKGINIGVSNKDDNLYFSTDRGTMDRIVSKEYNNSVKVNVTSMDNLIDNDIPLAIKIDVEGYEMFVLEGAAEILKNKKVKVLILELNQSGEEYEINDDEIYKTVLLYGFKPYSYNQKMRKLLSLKTYNKDKFNTIFIRDELFVSERVINSKKIKIKTMEF